MFFADRTPLGNTEAGAYRSEHAERGRRVILFLHNGPAQLPSNPLLNQFHYLSRYLTGAAIIGSWASTHAEAERWRAESESAMGDFEYHPIRASYKAPAIVRAATSYARMVVTCLRWSRANDKKVDAVVGYSPYVVGLAALCAARLLGARLVIQVPTDMRSAFVAQPGRLNGIKRWVQRAIATAVLKGADGWHIYFDGQTAGIVPNPGTQVDFFPDFSPVSAVPKDKKPKREFLVVGFPWSVKGVDIAIKAFRRSGEALTEWRLRVIGHCDDPSPYEALAGGDARISFEEPLPHHAVLEEIAGCGVFVLASRTEGIARVAVEALSAGRPVISTRVGGMQLLVRDGETGLLVDPEDEAALSKAMVRLAGDESLRDRMGNAARRMMEIEYSEDGWAQKLAELVERVSTDRRT